MGCDRFWMSEYEIDARALALDHRAVLAQSLQGWVWVTPYVRIEEQ